MQHRWIIGIIAAFLLMTSGVVSAARLGVPGPHTPVSGIGVISGWKCDAGALTVRFDGGEPIPVLYGAERADVLNEGACDHANVGFVSIMNWGNLDDGEHTAVVYDDGVEFGRSVFTVRRFREAFVRGASLTLPVQDFPHQGDNAVFTWSQATQHLELADAFAAPTSTDPPNCAGWVSSEGDHDSPEWVQACLEAGADPNARDERGRTPLHLIGGDEGEVAALLLAAGADPNARDNDGSTPLHEIYSGEAAALLLAAGADPNARDKWGGTPLHSTVSYGSHPNFEMAVVLLEAGADPNVRDEDGDTPLHRLRYTSKYLGELERAFIRAGADPNLLEDDGTLYLCGTFECMAKKTYRRER